MSQRKIVVEPDPILRKKSEFLIEKGMIDMIVPRKNLPSQISEIITKLTHEKSYDAMITTGDNGNDKV